MRFTDEMKQEFTDFRNGTGSILKQLVMDMQPGWIDGKWHVISEERPDISIHGPVADEQAAWDWIRSVKILE